MNHLQLFMASFTNQLSYPKKFITLITITILVISILVYQLIAEGMEKKRIDNKEQQAVEWISPAIDLLSAVIHYRSQSQLYLNRIPMPKDSLDNAKKEVDSALNNLTNVNNTLVDKLEIPDFLSIFKLKWENMKNQSYLSQSVDFYMENSAFVDIIMSAIITVSDKYIAFSDSEVDSYYNSENFIERLPDFINQVAKINDLALIALYTKNLSEADKNQLILLKSVLDKDLNIILNNIKKIISNNPSLASKYETITLSLYNTTGDLFLILTDSILNRSFNISFEDFSKKINTIMENAHQVSNMSINNFNNLVNARIHKTQIHLFINIFISLLGIFLLIFFYTSIYFSVIMNINKLVYGTKSLALEGDLTEPLKLETKDELLQIAEGFNMMQQILLNIITEMNDVVSASVQGDLSQKIDVSNKKGFSKQLGHSLNQLAETIQGAIADIVETLNALSKGDLSHKISKNYQGIFSDLKTYVNNTINSLEKLVIDLKNSIKIVNDRAKEIAQGNANLAKRTELQTDSLRETAVTVDELTQAVKKNVTNAQTANKLVVKASNVATEGGVIVNKVIDSMGLINESSNKILKITDLIDKISLQTNILALNAAVEANYAGEHGKGFSVIAKEIRKLAENSAYAAKEIKSLILATVNRVQDEMELVNQAGATMNEIVMSVKQVSNIMNEITKASDEQNNAIVQVNRVMLQLEEVAEQNTALVSEAATAARVLEVQTEHVDQLVGVFKLEE